jgi:hypothetical protein
LRQLPEEKTFAGENVADLAFGTAAGVACRGSGVANGVGWDAYLLVMLVRTMMKFYLSLCDKKPGDMSSFFPCRQKWHHILDGMVCEGFRQ